MLVGAAWGVPITWDGRASDLPGGCSDALARAVGDLSTGAAADTLVVCAVQVHPDRRGQGLAQHALTALIDTADQRGLRRVVAPLRPTSVHLDPLGTVEAHAARTRPDGSAADPWLRTHQRMGARVIATTPASQVFTGTAAQWRRWTGLALATTGTHLVPHALAPLLLDLTSDRVTLTEPGIWVRHR